MEPPNKGHGEDNNIIDSAAFNLSFVERSTMGGSTVYIIHELAHLVFPIMVECIPFQCESLFPNGTIQHTLSQRSESPKKYNWNWW